MEVLHTRALQAYLGHRNIQNTTRYTALAPGRFNGMFVMPAGVISHHCHGRAVGARPTTFRVLAARIVVVSKDDKVSTGKVFINPAGNPSPRHLRR